jgi:polar amino acid transport system substrate-binding protein
MTLRHEEDESMGLTRGRFAASLAVLVVGAIVLAVAAAAATVPPKYQSGLKVVADATYAPNEFFASDGKTVVGMDADLAKAIGGVLHVKVTMVNARFDTIIPGLQSGKYDLGMSSFTDTKAREKVVDFVTYFSAGTSFYGKVSSPKIVSLGALCGHTVGVESGTTQATDATAQKATCKKAGKSGVTVSVFPDQNGVNLALSSGRVQVAMADSPVAAYQVTQSKGQFALMGKPYGTAPYGIAIPKKSGLAQPVLSAMKTLMKNGTYVKILKKWNIQEGAIQSPKINGATS